MSVCVTLDIVRVLSSFAKQPATQQDAQYKSIVADVKNVLQKFKESTAKPQGGAEQHDQVVVKARVLRSVCDWLRTNDPSEDGKGPWLHEVIRGSKLHTYTPPARVPTPKTKEYIERTKQIQRMMEDQEYAKMMGMDTKTPFARTKPGEDNLSEWNKMFSAMSVGVNVLVTMVTCFVACYFVAYQVWGDETKATVLGAFGLVAALLVESVLFVIRAQRYVE